MDRRALLGLGVSAVALLSAPRARAAGDAATVFAEALEAIERRSGGRLGVALVEVGGGRRWSFRGRERFPLCSTFKALLAAAVLERVDRGEETLRREIPVAAADVVVHSPFVSARVGATATVQDLCEAAVTLSDNASANLLLASLGGQAGLTRFLRAAGDPTTRLDRLEPALSEAAPGDPRDTTTPEAMAATMERLLFGEILTPASRGALIRWLVDSQTGARRLRAGLPLGWTVGDKTGGGENGTTNDVAAIWRSESAAPVVLASYLTGSTLDADGRDVAHTDVARAAVVALA